ncbi:MAG: hypothetical protein ABSF16_08010 [Terracidiphilus sp.]
MSYLPRFGRLSLLALAVAFLAAGCHKNQDQSLASDPASANLAPVSTDASSAAPATYSSQPSAPAPDSGETDDQGNYDPGYGEQPEYTADQAPPLLPDYDQPPDPGDDYLWTPGYWAWAPEGYYWVPGVWTEAPYVGALWTPGYWGYWNHHFRFYHGYWGQYIGFYGGINYGYGYTGAGYQGGYWNGGHFNYNTTVNNINTSVVHNVYSHSVTTITNNNHVSFNGGSGGVQVRARPAELVALRAPHVAPMTAQIQNQHAASTNKAQFAAVNNGHPASVAVRQPLAADRNVKPPPPLQIHNQVAPQEQQRQATPQVQQHETAPQQQMHPVTPQQRQVAPQPQMRPITPQQRQTAPQPQAHQLAPQQHAVAPEPHPAAPPPQRQRALQPHPAAPPHPAPPPQPHPVAPQRPAPPQRPVAPQRPEEQRPK